MRGVKKYSGYRSFSYLEPSVDYTEFVLAPEFNRVPSRGPSLSDTQTERAERILREHVVISLHDHPVLFPVDMSQARAYNRQGRHWTGYEGLAASGMDAVFDNLMDGVCCITSETGWKWTDIVHDLVMRLLHLSHQDLVVKAEGIS